WDVGAAPKLLLQVVETLTDLPGRLGQRIGLLVLVIRRGQALGPGFGPGPVLLFLLLLAEQGCHRVDVRPGALDPLQGRDQRILEIAGAPEGLLALLP